MTSLLLTAIDFIQRRVLEKVVFKLATDRFSCSVMSPNVTPNCDSRQPFACSSSNIALIIWRNTLNTHNSPPRGPSSVLPMRNYNGSWLVRTYGCKNALIIWQANYLTLNLYTAEQNQIESWTTWINYLCLYDILHVWHRRSLYYYNSHYRWASQW